MNRIFGSASIKTKFGMLDADKNTVWYRMAMHPQEKNSCSLVLKLKVFLSLYFQVLTGALHTVYHESSSLFKKCTRYFFQRDTSSEAVVIAIVEADPLAKIVSVFLFPSLYTYWDLRSRKLHYKRVAPVLKFPLFLSVFLAVSRMAITQT